LIIPIMLNVIGKRLAGGLTQLRLSVKDFTYPEVARQYRSASLTAVSSA
jgi:hypothetical protein